MASRSVRNAWALSLSLVAAAPLLAQGARLLDAASVTERDDHLDLTIDFACSLRYQSYSPASDSASLRVLLQTGPDCGLPPNAQFPVDRILPADSAGLVRSIELSPALAGGVELIINWNRIEKFVLAPTSGMRGLRIRVTRRRAATVQVDGSPQPLGEYSVNLASTTDMPDPAAIARAAVLVDAPVYVSDFSVDARVWHRLRAGPFNSRRDAERVLRDAQRSYPSAWLAIGDEPQIETTKEGELVELPSTPSPAPRPEKRQDPQLDAAMVKARAALARKQYDAVISQLTAILVTQDYVYRVHAQELLGLAQERAGHLAQAKEAYEEFLRRYAGNEAVPRVRQRLQALRTASLPGRRGSGGGSAQDGWTVYGNASQIYRHDDSQLSTDVVSRNLTTQNALVNDMDWVARRRGERFDFTARTSFGYVKDMMTAGPGDQARVTSAYAELNDRELGLRSRLGRQSRGMAGINSSFDGMLASWQWKPQLGLSMAAGLPVESSRNAPATNRRFIGIATDVANEAHSLDASFYLLAQQYAGATDRRSVGIEARLLRPGRTLIANIDYDLHFGELNNLMLLGTAVLDSRWTFNFDASRQRSPLLSIRNALIGQPTLSFGDLSQTFAQSELDQLATDRSAQLTQLGLSAAHPVGENGQWTVSLYSTDLSGTPASGGVEAVPAQGREDAVTSEYLLSSLFKAGDNHSIALRYQRGGTGYLWSAGLGSRLPLGSSFNLTARLRAEHRGFTIDDSTQWTWLPSLRLDYRRGPAAFELEAGGELASRNRVGDTERNTRYFVSVGYRYSFDWRRK